MNRENRPVVTDELVEFEKQLVVEVQDLKKITDCLEKSMEYTSN
jgi:hypothetical protein